MKEMREIHRLLCDELVMNIERVCSAFAFEPNDEMTRCCVRAELNEYFGTCVDKKLIHSCEVLCSRENNPPEVIDLSEMMVGISIDFNGKEPGVHMDVTIGTDG